MNLKDKLKNIDSTISRTPSIVKQCHDRDIDYYMGGEEIVNTYGRFYLTKTFYPARYIHGNFPLSMIWDTDSGIFQRAAKDERLATMNFQKILFIDTETTGLAGGTGTVPFLIGLGYFTEEDFCVEQFFMRDYHEEPALLHAVCERLSEYQTLISYNGKSYDMNILSTRFILSRMANAAEGLPHFDLLHTVRRIWRRRLADCSLTNIEASVLGFTRTNDIPGFMIPGLYFNYLRNREAKPLISIFQHNCWDILSLVVLVALTGHIYKNPLSYLNHPHDLFSLGRAYEQLSCPEETIVCFEAALKYPMHVEEREEILRFLSFFFKRLGRWHQAIKIWKDIVETVPYRIYPYEELAKYYEHREKDFNKAIALVKKALERAEMFEILHSDKALKTGYDDLLYRLARLKRKLKEQ